jgi:hypothetical protein
MVVLFHRWSLDESVLRFGYDNKPHASSIALDKALNYRHHTEHSSQPVTLTGDNKKMGDNKKITE